MITNQYRAPFQDLQWQALNRYHPLSVKILPDPFWDNQGAYAASNHWLAETIPAHS